MSPRGFGSSCLLGQPSPRVAKVGVVGGELRLWPAQSGGEATRRRWGGGRSRPKGGEGGRRRTRVPGLVTAGGSRNRHPDSPGEMAGCRDPRVVDTLHLLLLVAVLPLAVSGVRRVWGDDGSDHPSSPRGDSPAATHWPPQWLLITHSAFCLRTLALGLPSAWLLLPRSSTIRVSAHACPL